MQCKIATPANLPKRPVTLPKAPARCLPASLPHGQDQPHRLVAPAFLPGTILLAMKLTMMKTMETTKTMMKTMMRSQRHLPRLVQDVCIRRGAKYHLFQTQG